MRGLYIIVQTDRTNKSQEKVIVDVGSEGGKTTQAAACLRSLELKSRFISPLVA